MTTREQYAVVRLGSTTIGIQARLDEFHAIRRELMMLDGRHVRGSVADVASAVEDMVKAAFPGRAYWIEVGDDESWVQVVEYGAFSGKPHKAGL